MRSRANDQTLAQPLTLALSPLWRGEGSKDLRSPCRPSAAAAGHRHRGLLLRHFGDHRLGGDEEACDGGRVLQRGAHDLGRIDDAGLDHVDVFVGLRVEAPVLRLVLADLADHDRAFSARVLGDLPDRRFERLQHDADAGLLVGVLALELADRRLGAQQRNAAARDDAFLDRRSGGVEGVVDAVLLLLDLDLGRAADADDRDAARELGETLLELLTVVVRGRLLDLRLDLPDAALDVLLGPGAVDDRGVLLLDADALGLAEHLKVDVLELDAEVFCDHRAAGQDRRCPRAWLCGDRRSPAP